jgi:hypothetical protein
MSPARFSPALAFAHLERKTDKSNLRLARWTDACPDEHLEPYAISNTAIHAVSTGESGQGAATPAILAIGLLGAHQVPRLIRSASQPLYASSGGVTLQMVKISCQ